MKLRPYRLRTTADAAARKIRDDPAERLVLACVACPKSKRSERPRSEFNAAQLRRVRRIALDAGADPERLRASVDADRNRAASEPKNGTLRPGTLNM